VFPQCHSALTCHLSAAVKTSTGGGHWHHCVLTLFFPNLPGAMTNPPSRRGGREVGGGGERPRRVGSRGVISMQSAVVRLALILHLLRRRRRA